MTPRAFFALQQRRRENLDNAHYLALLPTCAIYNVHRTDEKQEFLTPEKIMGTKKPQKRQTMQEMKTIILMLNEAFGGEDRREHA